MFKGLVVGLIILGVVVAVIILDEVSLDAPKVQLDIPLMPATPARTATTPQVTPQAAPKAAPRALLQPTKARQPAADAEVLAYARGAFNQVLAACLRMVVEAKGDIDVEAGEIRDFGNLLDAVAEGTVCQEYVFENYSRAELIKAFQDDVNNQ